MKNILALAILTTATVALPACVTGTAPTAQPSTVKTSPADVRPHVKRPNLLVADMDRSLTIYRDILGFSFDRISTSSEDSYSYPVFNIPRETRMRYTYLGEPGEARVLGLTEVTGAPLPRPAAAPFMSTVVIGVTDLMGIREKLGAMGLDMTEPKTAGGAEFTFVEMAFTDPDGHLIVLYEVVGE